MKMNIKIKKQTGYIILIFISIILLCLYFGKSIIHEGNEGTTTTMSTTGGSVSYPIAQQNLQTVSGIKKEATTDLTEATNAAIIKEREIAAANALINIRTGESQNYDERIRMTLQYIIDSTITPPVVYLPLYINAKNIAKKSFPGDPSNMMNDANVDINGRTTNITYYQYNGKQYAYFQNDMNNYLSFPFNLSPAFSFCFWIYVDVNDNNYYTVVSATNKQYLIGSIQVDIVGGRFLVFNGLPKRHDNWTIFHDYTVNTSGWTHVAYTFVGPTTANVYINKNQSKFVQNFKTEELAFFTNVKDPELLKFSPDTFIIGRSGFNDRAYVGRVRDFSYYAMTLNIDQITNIYNYTK